MSISELIDFEICGIPSLLHRLQNLKLNKIFLFACKKIICDVSFSLIFLNLFHICSLLIPFLHVFHFKVDILVKRHNV